MTSLNAWATPRTFPFHSLEAMIEVRIAGDDELEIVHRVMLEAFEDYRGVLEPPPKRSPRRSKMSGTPSRAASR